MSKRRRSFLINKEFQIKFCLYVCSWLFVLSLLYPMVIYQLFDRFMVYVALDPNGPAVGLLNERREKLIQLLVILQALFLSVTFLVSMFVSHRIAGPLFKLKQFFRRASEGDTFSTLSFRKADHFQDLARSYNDMMSGLRHNWASKLESTEKEIESALKSCTGSAKTELEKALHSIRELRKEC